MADENPLYSSGLWMINWVRWGEQEKGGQIVFIRVLILETYAGVEK